MATTTPVKIGLIGGGGGNSQDILPNQLPRNLEKIEIWSSADGPDSGAVINGIRFTYVDVQGRRHIVPSQQGVAWGTATGNFHEFNIDTGTQEYVTRIDCRFGPAPDGDEGITYLKITTSSGRTVTCGDPSKGTAFTVPLKNAGIFAFFASSDAYLNALGFYVQPYP